MKNYNPNAKAEFTQMTQNMTKKELKEMFGLILRLSEVMEDRSKNEPT